MVAQPEAISWRHPHQNQKQKDKTTLGLVKAKQSKPKLCTVTDSYRENDTFGTLPE